MKLSELLERVAIYRKKGRPGFDDGLVMEENPEGADLVSEEEHAIVGLEDLQPLMLGDKKTSVSENKVLTNERELLNEEDVAYLQKHGWTVKKA